MHRLTVILLFVFSATFLQGQNFVASSNAKTVVKGSTFSVSFEIKSSSAKGFVPPDFTPFKVISGPSRSYSTSIVNGRRSSSYIISYTLLAREKGQFTIPPATIKLGKQRYISNSIEIEVMEGKRSTNTEDVIVQVELDEDTIKVGQQIVLTLKLYSTVPVQRYDVLQMPEFNDVYVKELPRFNRRVNVEVLNGVQYESQVLRRMALFPQKSGRFDFDGLIVQLGIPTNQGGRRNSFFFNTQLRTVQKFTEDFGFTVERLPEPQPRSFSGGVGSYQIEVRSDRTRLSTDDALTLTLSVKGDGDSRLLMPPDLDIGEDFDTYDANIIKTEEQPAEERNRFLKVFEYLIIPKNAGQPSLIPKFTYFNVDSQSYVTLAPDTIGLDVRQGTSESKALRAFKEDQKLDIGNIVHQWGADTDKISFLKSPIYWALWLVSFGFLGGLMVYRRGQLKIAGMDPEVLRYKRARKVAEKRLQHAHALMQGQEEKAFFEEIALAIKQYLGDKLKIDPSNFSKQNISAKLGSNGVDSNLIEAIVDLLETCDLAIFAPSSNVQPQDVYERTIQIVMDLEEGMS